MSTDVGKLMERLEMLEKDYNKKERDYRQLQDTLQETQTELAQLKKELLDLKESLEYTQREQDELKDRVNLCEKEQDQQGERIQEQDIYNRRWNLIFHGIDEDDNEDCQKKVVQVIEEYLHLPAKDVVFCAVHRLGKKKPCRG